MAWHMGSKNQNRDYADQSWQNTRTPRKRFSLILKLNHMLYKNNIEPGSDIN